MPENKNKWEDLLDPRKRIEIKLASLLSQLKTGNIALVIVKSEHYSFIPMSLLKLLKKKLPQGVFVSANKPLTTLLGNANAIAAEKNIVFIDLVSENAGIPKIDAPNTRYFETQQNLVELSVLIENELKNPKTERFVVIDSLSTIALYNKPEVVERFVHNITGKLHHHNALGLVLMVRLNENEDLVRVVSQFCDQTVEISENETKTKS